MCFSFCEDLCGVLWDYVFHLCRPHFFFDTLSLEATKFRNSTHTVKIMDAIKQIIAVNMVQLTVKIYIFLFSICSEM